MAKRDSSAFVPKKQQIAIFNSRIVAIYDLSVSHSEHGCANLGMVALTAALRPIHVDKQHVKEKGSVAIRCTDEGGVVRL